MDSVYTSTRPFYNFVSIIIMYHYFSQWFPTGISPHTSMAICFASWWNHNETTLWILSILANWWCNIRVVNRLASQMSSLKFLFSCIVSLVCYIQLAVFYLYYWKRICMSLHCMVLSIHWAVYHDENYITFQHIHIFRAFLWSNTALKPGHNWWPGCDPDW